MRLKFPWVAPKSPAVRSQLPASTRGVPNFTIVRMYFTGYDPNGNATFVFFHQVPNRYMDLPPHDQRDNYNGGLAFGVYHPGTVCRSRGL